MILKQPLLKPSKNCFRRQKSNYVDLIFLSVKRQLVREFTKTCQRMDSGERYAKRRPEDLISKYEKIKNALNRFDNLPTALKPLSLLSKLQCLKEL